MALFENRIQRPISLRDIKAKSPFYLLSLLVLVLWIKVIFDLEERMANPEEIKPIGIILKIILLILLSFSSRIRDEIYLYDSLLISGWKVPFFKKLFRSKEIEKQNFGGLFLEQITDQSFTISAKDKNGKSIVIRNIINKNPAETYYEKLKSNEFKNWG
jgi:hypothetical protein